MSIDNWLKLISFIVEIIKTTIPFGIIFFIFWIFRKELRELIKSGGWKFSAPGISMETAQKQQKKTPIKEKKEIDALNKELEDTKTIQKKLQELQEYTARDKESFFIGFHFERTYRIIFPSQMVILLAIQNQGEMTIPLAEAIFRRTMWAQILNFSYDQYISFLFDAGLIIKDKDNLKYYLAPLGKAFLEYIKQNNIPNKLPALDMQTKEQQPNAS